MSVTECALCGRTGDSRSMLSCEYCHSPLCDECARLNHNRCDECADETSMYDGR